MSTATHTLSTPRVFLWGLMGSGKSTLGRQLAHLLDRPFQDLDTATETLAGLSIPDIFRTLGETRFRELERDALHQCIAAHPAGVFAAGGGLPCFFDNAVVMNAAGATLWLDVPLAELVRRLIRTRTDRPLLLAEDGTRLTADQLTDRLQNLYRLRLPYYRQAQQRIVGANLQVHHLLQALGAEARGESAPLP